MLTLFLYFINHSLYLLPKILFLEMAEFTDRVQYLIESCILSYLYTNESVKYKSYKYAED